MSDLIHLLKPCRVGLKRYMHLRISGRTSYTLSSPSSQNGLNIFYFFLDDYLIQTPVDTERVVSIINYAINNNSMYLRLLPPARAFLTQLGNALKNHFKPAGFETLKTDAPYFASLQVALWDREHLKRMLRNATNIWEFENSYIPGVDHHAILEKPPIRYVHVVEKGKWQPHAASLFEQAGLSFDPSERPLHSLRHYLTLWINKIKFAVFGYSVFRLRSRCKNKGIPIDGSL